MPNSSPQVQTVIQQIKGIVSLTAKKHFIGSIVAATPRFGTVFRLPFGKNWSQTAEWIVYDALYAYCQEIVSGGKADGAVRESI